MHQTTPRPKAYSYLRFSTVEQGKGDSYRRQTALAEDFCRVRGLDLDRTTTFEDLGVSAYSGKNRRKGALRAFLDAVEEEIIPEGSYLLVESLDRVSREAILDAQATFLQIVNAGITLVTLKGTPREYSRATVNANPTDLLISLLEMIRANEESETKSQRIKADWNRKRQRALDGEAITSLVPAWLERSGKDFKVIEERAAIVRRIFSLTLEGKGQHAITSLFNKEGIKPFGSAKWWHRSYVRLVLRSPAVIGTFVPHRMVEGKRIPLEPIRNYFPAVIDVETYEAVRALDQPRASPPRTIASMFSGLVRCEECGGPMVRARKGQPPKPFYYVFVCHNAKLGQSCECRTVRQSVLEDALRADFVRFIEEAPTHDDDLTAQLEAVEDALSEMQGRAARLVEAISQRPLAQLVDRLAEVNEGVAELKEKQAELTAAFRDTARPVMLKRLADLSDLLESQDSEVTPRIQVQLRQVLDHIVVHFDREASRRKPRGYIEFVWKGGGRSYLDWGPVFYAASMRDRRANR
ncbi:recombinase family protein [Phreatobacter cathodiphilus]|uniref:Recombinase family protein n=1 Tax=Phreatobacter cathodiphilus TaxID=1868589 RepID=A0A2S0N7Q7_9HYPH|nr:recombinase family protein [Phreatobacter cathodiphilus]AVO44047.1 hypothetical protein C6569_02630 [Phreatobacter cathodiphilus]